MQSTRQIDVPLGSQEQTYPVILELDNANSAATNISDPDLSDIYTYIYTHMYRISLQCPLLANPLAREGGAFLVLES